MKVLSYIADSRIRASNVAIEITTRDYIEVAKDIVDKNEFQRRKVISSRLKTALKRDILKNCTIPPIVLGVKEIEVPKGFDYQTFKSDVQIQGWFESKALIVLDGLQRTHVLMELFEENKDGAWLDQKLRCEVYVGLEKLGVLYRMLTLNTGQTTMSTRHLLEILYHDYLNTPLDGGIRLIKDKDDEIADPSKKEYSFRDTLDGYASFINGREIPIERAEILQNVETIDRLERSDYEKEGFQRFVQLYHAIISTFAEHISFAFDKEKFKSAEYALKSSPFGLNVLDVFARSQSLTGCGAALSFLRDKRSLGFDDVTELLKRVNYAQGVEGMDKLILAIDLVKTRSNKVGNDQRYFFREFFISLFDKEKEECFLDFDASVNRAKARVEERIQPDTV
jgi:hypothetical protein